jgi:inorganic triphosphatase YgiF
MVDSMLTMMRPAPILLRGETWGLLGTATMEIEAKFSVPDPVVYWSLQTTDHLAGYSLSTTQVKPVWDTYLDTKRHRILAAGYSCRRRVTREGIVITLKSLGGAEGGVHRRGEWELRVAASRPPVDWPDSPVRDLVLQLIGQEPLLTLFELQQTRVIRLLKRGEQPVAELRLDRVSLITNDREQVYLDVEVELLPQTSEETLRAIVGCLQDSWHLKPEPLSKFERALDLLDVL